MASILDAQNLNFELKTPGLSTGSATAGKSEASKELEGAAGQFEAIFLKMFLDQARQSKLSDDILGSSASDNFQEMFDNEITQLGGKSFNLGLTDVIIRQLQTDREQ